MTLSRRAFVLFGGAMALSGCSSFAKTVAPAGATSPAALTVERITSEINGTRKHYGAHPLAYNYTLDAAARTHVELMAAQDTMSHELGGTLRERVTAAGYYGAVGENLAQGQKTLEAAIAGWLDSSSHRETLLNNKFAEFGLAVATDSKGRPYWAFITGGPFEAWR